MMQGLVPLGLYQRADGMSGPMCFSPYEQIDPETCANWGAVRIAMTERTIICGRQGA